MQIFDAHLDLALNAVDWNRDLSLSIDEIRRQETELGMAGIKGRCTNTVSFPELRTAQVATCLATLLARQEAEINHDFGCITAETCYAMANAHLAYYRAMERVGRMRMLTNRSQLREHIEQFAQSSTAPLGFILTMEGADPILTVDTIEEFHAMGLRAIGQ